MQACSRRVKELRNFSEIPQECWRSRCTRAPSISTIVFKCRNKSQVGSMGSKKLMGQIWRICSKVRRTCEEIAKVNGREFLKHQGGYNFATRYAFTWFSFHTFRTLWDTLYAFIPSHSQKWDLLQKYDRTKVLPVTLKQKIKQDTRLRDLVSTRATCYEVSCTGLSKPRPSKPKNFSWSANTVERRLIL